MPFEARVDGGELVDPAIDLLEPGHGRRLVVVEQRIGLVGQCGEAAGVGLDHLLVLERLLLSVRELRGLDLLRLVLEHLAPPFPLAAVAAKCLALLVTRGDGREASDDLPGIDPGMAVEELDMGLRIEQSLRLMLPVDRDELYPQLPRERHRNEGAVDSHPSLPRGLQLAPYDDLVPAGEGVTLQERVQPRPLGDALHDRLLLPAPNQFWGGTAAQYQP